MDSQVDLSQLAVDRSETAADRPRFRGHLLTRYVVPATLVFGILALMWWASRDLFFPPKEVTVIPVLATEAEVQREGTPLFHAAGWIEPRPTPVRAAALAAGVVENLLVVEDQAVKAGQPLAELIKDDAQLAHDRTAADLRLREAEWDQANAAQQAATTRFEQPVHLQAALGDAEAALARVQTQLTNLPFETRRAAARLEFARQDHEGKAAAAGAIAQREIDLARSELEAARALVEELQGRTVSLQGEQKALVRRRDALQTQLELLADEIQAKDEAAAKVKAATARVEQARVAVAESKLQLDRMIVRSPIDGRVYTLIAHPGARIGDGVMTAMEGYDGSTVVTLYRPTVLQVRVDVRFEDIPHVILGQNVRIESPAVSEPLTGNVLFISSLADIQKNTLQVKVEIESPPPVFKPEMLVDVTFLAPKQTGGTSQRSTTTRLYVPQTLIQDGDNGTFVWVADQAAGVARSAPVTTGIVGNIGLIEITAGLTPSSRLIVGGIDGIEDGDRIRVTGESTATTPGDLSTQGGNK